MVILFGTTHAAVEADRLLVAIEKLQGYEYAKTDVDLAWVELQVAMASADKSVRGQVEDKLIESLAKSKTNAAKEFYCRQLRTVGTAKCVAQLASMLTDPEMSHMARYALGRIDAPEAGAALVEAMGKTSGKIKAGIINTLVQMEYGAAGYDIMKLIYDTDQDVAIAAIRGTGVLGDRRAFPELKKLRATASAGIQAEIDAAILTSADKLMETGQLSNALVIYQEYYKENYPVHLRMAGLKGIVRLGGPKVPSVLVEAIKGQEPTIRKYAIMMMAQVEGENTTRQLVELIEAAPSDGQELIVRSLAARKDVSAEPAVIELVGSDSEIVRLAVLEALGDIGTPRAVPILAKAAASGPDKEQAYARSSLVRLNGQGIGQAIIDQINSGDAKTRLGVIRAIGMRVEYDPFAPLLKVAQTDEDASIRREAILSMARIAKPSDLDTFVKLAVAPKSPADRGSIVQAIEIVFNKIEDRMAQAGPVLAALKTAADDAKASLLGLLAIPATPEALEAVSAAVASENNDVSNAAIRALAEWPTAAPAEQLYKIASSSPNQTQKILALRAYIRLAPLTQDPTASYVSAMQLAKRSEEIRLVLAGLQYAGTRKALEIAESYMNDPALKAEAYMAAVKVANVYGWQDIQYVTDLLNRIVADAPNDTIGKQAKDILQKMNKFKGGIFVWRGTPLLTLPGVADGNRVFKTVFDPEKDFNSEDIIWRVVLPEFEGSGKIDLERTYGQVDNCCAYLRTTVVSPVDQEAKLKWVCDDLIKGWLNGESVKEGAIKLKKGANPFIIKVGDNGGGWSFECQILKPDDSPLDGLRFEY